MWWWSPATRPIAARRHVETYGEPPQRVAFDGGYASRANLVDGSWAWSNHKMNARHSSAWIYGSTEALSGGRGSRQYDPRNGERLPSTATITATNGVGEL